MSEKKYVTVAVVGCTHGHMNQLYEDIKKYEDETKGKVDILLCCGDYQSMRNMSDVQAMACPNKYKKIGDFPEYYSGKKVAPVPTIFIGGNHEASVHNLELFHGGWAAQNIYFLGHCGCVNFKGLRIAGQSGIYKPYDYNRGYFERVPLNNNDMRSLYHHRYFDEFKLCNLTGDIDIFLSHDWPRGIWKNEKKSVMNSQLRRMRRDMSDAIRQSKLGAPGLENIYKHLKPRYFFSGHMHTKFSCKYTHNDDEDEKVTNFLALAKPDPRGGYIDFIKVEVDDEKYIEDDEIRYDLEWLSIVRVTDQFLSIRKKMGMIPISGIDEVIKNEMGWIKERMKSFRDGVMEDLVISKNPLVVNRRTYDGNEKDFFVVKQIEDLENPQRSFFCEFLDIKDKIAKMQRRKR